MALLRRMDEKMISTHELYGKSILSIETEIKKMIDIVMNDKRPDVDYDFFDLHGIVLLYGIPGTGKTTLMKNCMHYALDRYGTDCYDIPASEIIVSELGKTTKNLSEALNEFERKDQGILFIDEIDQFCINRMDDEISELKRMLIELMQFFDRQTAKNKKMVLCCTNVFDQLDNALKRRFSICEKIEKPSKEELCDFANICIKKADMKERVIDIRDVSIATFDDIKCRFRNVLLTRSGINESFVMEVN